MHKLDAWGTVGPALVTLGLVASAGCASNVLGGAGGTATSSSTAPTTSSTPPGSTTTGGQTAASGDAGSASSPTCAGSIAYRLVQTRNIAAPIADATGITFDGTDLWLLGGGQNSFTNTLARFDPTTLTLDRHFTLQDLIGQLGTGAYGITWDGASIWISVSGDTNKLVIVDPITGAVTGGFSSPTDLGPSDLDYDGTSLWLSSGTGTVFRIDPKTTSLMQQFPTAPDSYGRDDGIAYRPGEVWVGNLFGGLNVYDAATGAVKGAVVHDDCSPFTGSQSNTPETGPSVFIAGQYVVLSPLGITYYSVEGP